MFTVICVLFDPRDGSRLPKRSRVYSPQWVDIMWRMLNRNLTKEWLLLCLTHYPKESFRENVKVVPLLDDTREVWCINEVFRSDLGIERGMFIALDSVIVQNIDHMASFNGFFALPGYHMGCELKYTNPIALFSRPAADLMWRGAELARNDPSVQMNEFGPSEMRYWSKYAPEATEDIHKLWPRHIAPYQLLREGPLEKREVRPAPPEEMLKEARIITFGFSNEKPHNTTLEIARRHWR